MTQTYSFDCDRCGEHTEIAADTNKREGDGYVQRGNGKPSLCHDCAAYDGVSAESVGFVWKCELCTDTYTDHYICPECKIPLADQGVEVKK